MHQFSDILQRRLKRGEIEEGAREKRIVEKSFKDKNIINNKIFTINGENVIINLNNYRNLPVK